MSDKNFDQHLKSVLENLEPVYDASTWAVLEQRMNAVFTEEQPSAVDPIDKALFHTLDRMDAPYQPGHWKLMSERLDVLRLRLRHLRLAKLTELFMVVLLLWNVPAFLGNSAKQPYQPQPYQPGQEVPVAQAGSRKFSGSEKGASASPNYPSAYSKVYVSALQGVLAVPGVPNLLGADHLSAPSVRAMLLELNALGDQTQKRIFAATDQLPGDVLVALNLPERAVQLPIIPVQQFKSAGPFYLAASGSYDHNRVLVNEKRRSVSGYGADLALGVRKGKWGFETGIGYSNVSYTPKREVEIYAGNFADGYVGSALTKVHTEMVAVPLKVSRRLAQVGTTSAHAVAGVSANFAVQKTFDYGTVYYSPDALPPNFLPDPNQTPKLRKTGRGILEKGQFKENFFATVDLGVRLEQPFSKGRYTAFLEPTYRQAISGNGVGPNREPVNTLSIQAGVMAFL